MSYIANSVNPDGVRAQEIIESLTGGHPGGARPRAAVRRAHQGALRRRAGLAGLHRRAVLPAAARAPDRHRARHQGRHRGRDRRHRALQHASSRRPSRSTRSPRTWSSPSCATRRATGACSRATCASTRPRGWRRDASARREEGHQARAPVRGDQGVRQVARRVDRRAPRRSRRAPSTRSARAPASRARASRTSTQDISSGRRGGQRSGSSGPRGRTRDQLYNEAKNLGVEGRSKMNKAQLQRAVDNKKR